MLPEAVRALGNNLLVYPWLVAGFLVFFTLEQFLHWHHCHRSPASAHRPLGHLILIADGGHNFIGGLAVGGALVTYAVSGSVEVGCLLPFAAGNFIYIAAADLIPEIARETQTRDKLETSLAFLAGLGLLLAVTRINS